MISRRNFLQMMGSSTIAYSLSPLASPEHKPLYDGVDLELEYQRKMIEQERQSSYEGTNLILIDEDSVPSIGNVYGAAKTLKSILNGNSLTKPINSVDEMIRILSEKGKKFRRVFYYGHGDVTSFWIGLDILFLESLPQSTINRIKDNLADCIAFKTYTCHAAADSDYPIIAAIADTFNVNTIGSNAWVFISNYLDGVYMFPATRSDYRKEFKTNVDDPAYSGQSEWKYFLKR